MTQPTIIAVGELLVEFVSHSLGCELRKLSEFSGPYPSGAPAICIDQASRVGAAAQIFGTVGDDNFGNALIDRLVENGVETSGVVRATGKTTGVAFVSYYEDGSRTFIFHLNNTAADAVDTSNISLPDGPLIMHISGSSLGNPHLRAAIEHTANMVLDAGGKLSCDPNARPELMGDPAVKSVLQNIIEKSSYLFPSDADFEFMYPGQTDEQSAQNLVASGAEVVALTRGEHGSIIYAQNQEPLHLGGHSVKEIDPTGAGDCYCGTFLAMIAQNHPLDVCGRYANAAGAIAVTRRGPMEGNSNLDEIETFMKNNPA